MFGQNEKLLREFVGTQLTLQVWQLAASDRYGVVLHHNTGHRPDSEVWQVEEVHEMVQVMLRASATIREFRRKSSPRNISKSHRMLIAIQKEPGVTQMFKQSVYGPHGILLSVKSVTGRYPKTALSLPEFDEFISNASSALSLLHWLMSGRNAQEWPHERKRAQAFNPETN